MAIMEKYAGRWFDERLYEENYLCMWKSYELRHWLYKFQEAVEGCLHDLLFFNEKEHQFLVDMNNTCHAFRYLPEEIGECMKCIQAVNAKIKVSHLAAKRS